MKRVRRLPSSQVLVALAVLVLGCTDEMPVESESESRLVPDGPARALPPITFTVTKEADTNDGACDADCSLREAIAAANAHAAKDEVIVPAGTYVLDALELSIEDHLTILGSTTGATEIIGAGSRIFYVQQYIVDMDHLIIRGGSSVDEGGGILNQQGELTITNSTIRNNSAMFGGGIFNNGGSLTIVNSVIDSNSATEGGGGIYEDGFDFVNTFRNTTIARNQASFGGGIRFDSCNDVLENTTISGNTALEGGGMAGGSCASIIIQNTILAGNSASAGSDCSIAGSTSLGNNIVGDPSGCGITLLPSDRTGDPGLAAFRTSGRAGFSYFPLLSTSPAIDAGNWAVCWDTDQLGRSRMDGDGDGDIVCDIGAIEFPTDIDDDGIADEIDLDPGDPSFEFSDVPLGGITGGIILDPGDQKLWIWDEPYPEGVRIVTAAGGGLAPAEVSACGYTYVVPAGKALSVLCGSATVKVFVGPIEILPDDHLALSVPTGAVVKVTRLAEAQFLIENLSPVGVDPIVVAVDGVEYYLPPGETLGKVTIDIRPGSDPNPINPRSGGVVPVAILGSEFFDVTYVDVSALAFGPNAAVPTHDLTDPLHYNDHIRDVNEDGFLDLVSHYRQKETGLQPGDTEACITGVLAGGITLEGCDGVTILQ